MHTANLAVFQCYNIAVYETQLCDCKVIHYVFWLGIFHVLISWYIQRSTVEVDNSEDNFSSIYYYTWSTFIRK